MNSQRHLSARPLLLMLALVIAASSPALCTVTSRVPNVKGHWSGTLSSEATGIVPFELDITKQNRKTGKVSGSAFALGRESRLSGTIKKNGATLTFKTFINDSEVTVTMKVKSDDGPDTVSGTFKAKKGGQVVAQGTVELHRAEM